jgi:hypothetical protein
MAPITVQTSAAEMAANFNALDERIQPYKLDYVYDAGINIELIRNWIRKNGLTADGRADYSVDNLERAVRALKLDLKWEIPPKGVEARKKRIAADLAGIPTGTDKSEFDRIDAENAATKAAKEKSAADGRRQASAKAFVERTQESYVKTNHRGRVDYAATSYRRDLLTKTRCFKDASKSEVDWYQTAVLFEKCISGFEREDSKGW